MFTGFKNEQPSSNLIERKKKNNKTCKQSKSQIYICKERMSALMDPVKSENIKIQVKYILFLSHIIY